MKVNTGKMKVLFGGSMKDRVEEKGKWPNGVCKKGVGNNVASYRPISNLSFLSKVDEKVVDVRLSLIT